MKDCKILRAGIVEALTAKEIDLVVLIFWHNHLLHEVSIKTKIPINDLQKLLDSALQKLKHFCIEQRDFSRSIFRTSSMAV